MKNLLRERERNNKLIDSLDIQVKSIQRELFGEEIGGIEVIKEKIGKSEGDIKEINVKMDKIKQKNNEYRINKKKAEEIINKISTIEKCPLCLQNVEHEHKNSITERENKNITEAEQNIIVCSKQEEQLKTELKGMEKELEELRKRESKIEIVKLKLKNVKEKIAEREKIEKIQAEIKSKVGEINTKKIETNIKIAELKDVEEIYLKTRKELDMTLGEEKKLDIEKISFEKEKESLNKMMKLVEGEIEKKIRVKEKLRYVGEIQNWLEAFFINLMGTVEKHIMLRVHSEFDKLFNEWFTILIEDETISVRLDDEFTPIVEQNGYETNIETLSGGEKNVSGFIL